MDIVQLVTLAVGILGLVWYQQRSIASLRAELKQEFAELRTKQENDTQSLRAKQENDIQSLRAELKQEFAELRAEIAALRAVVADNSQRLSRIEGFLGIGMPPEAAANAPGAGLAAASAGVASGPPAAASSS